MLIVSRAMQRFNPSESMWAILRVLHERHAAPSQPRSSVKFCASCGKPCGRTVRDCAEAHGGRKALKDKIRQLEAMEVGDKAADAKHDIAQELYQCYSTVGRIGGGQTRTADTSTQWRNDTKVTKPCAFCGKACGRAIRQCAESHGGRNALKNRIRSLDGEQQASHPPSVAKDVTDELFQCYAMVSRVGPWYHITTLCSVAERRQAMRVLWQILWANDSRMRRSEWWSQGAEEQDTGARIRAHGGDRNRRSESTSGRAISMLCGSKFVDCVMRYTDR